MEKLMNLMIWLSCLLKTYYVNVSLYEIGKIDPIEHE